MDTQPSSSNAQNEPSPPYAYYSSTPANDPNTPTGSSEPQPSFTTSDMPPPPAQYAGYPSSTPAPNYPLPPAYPAYVPPPGMPAYPPAQPGLSGPAVPPPVYPAYAAYAAYPGYPAYPMIPYPMPIYQPAEPGAGQAVASLVLGITALTLSVLLFLFFDCSLFIITPLGVLGIIFGALGRRSPSRKTMATVGLILSIVALVLMFGSLVFFFALNIALLNAGSAG